MTERVKYKTAEHRTPIGEPTEKGQFWCPYEGQWRTFVPKKMKEGHGYPRCTGCNISIEDWWIKKVNGLFESTSAKKKVKK